MAENENNEKVEKKKVEDKGSSSGNNMVMIVVIVMLLLMFVGLTVGFVMIVKNLNVIQNANMSNNQGEKIIEYKIEDLELYPLSESIKANLLKTKTDTKEHIAMITVTLGIHKGTTKEEKKEYEALVELVPTKEVIIRDAIITVLKNKTYVELESPDSKELLKEEILAEIQEIFATNLIVDVYFGEYYYQ